MTTYASFKDYYLRSIWRTGDTNLLTDFDKLVVKAEKRIERDLRQNQLPIIVSLLLPAGLNYVELTVPAQSVESVRWLAQPNNLKAEVYTYQDWREHYERYDSCRDGTRYAMGSYKEDEDSPLLTYLYININSDDSETIQVTGAPQFLSFTTNPLYPYYDVEPDFFEAALNVQVYKYLREFELSQEYQADYLGLLEDMRRKAAYERFPTSPLPSPMPDGVA